MPAGPLSAQPAYRRLWRYGPTSSLLLGDTLLDAVGSPSLNQNDGRLCTSLGSVGVFVNSSKAVCRCGSALVSPRLCVVQGIRASRSPSLLLLVLAFIAVSAAAEVHGAMINHLL